jgi:hypothetical protein
LAIAKRGIIAIEMPGNQINIKLTKDMAKDMLNHMEQGGLFRAFAPRIIGILSHKSSEVSAWGLTRLTPQEEAALQRYGDEEDEHKHEILVATGQVGHIEKHPKK